MKKINVPFISGLTIFALIFSFFSPVNYTYASEKVNEVNVRADVYEDDSVRDDVYQDEQNDDDIFEDVYADIKVDKSNLENYRDTDGNLVFHGNVNRYSNSISLALHIDALKELDSSDNIIFITDKNTLTVPKSSIADSAYAYKILEFTIDEDTIVGNELSPYYYISAYGYNDVYDYDHIQLSEPVTVTVEADKEKVRNWNIALAVINYEDYSTELLSENLKIDKETGKISASIKHLNANVRVIPNRTVTNDVYYFVDSTMFLEDYQDSNGNVVLKDLDTLVIPKHVLNQVDDNKNLLIKNDGFEVTIPFRSMKNLNYENRVLLTLEDNSWGYDNSLSSVYSLNFLSDSNQDTITDNFLEPVELTFTVDPNEVQNWNNLVLRYLDNTGNPIEDYTDQIVSIDKKSGKVIAEVYHFSEYGIFEVEGTEDEVDSDDESDEDKTTEPGVTDDVYYEIINEDQLNELKDENGNIVFENAENVLLTNELANSLDNELKISIKQGNMLLSLTGKLFKEIASEGNFVRINIEDVTSNHQNENALSQLFKFNIYQDNNKKYKKQFTEPLTLTFIINPTKVKNWDNLTLLYIDEDRKVTNYADQIINIDRVTGEVVVEVNHFSTYGIFEVENTDNGFDSDDPSVIPGTDDESDDEEPVTPDNNNESDDEEPVTPDNNNESDDEESVTPDNNNESDDEESVTPDNNNESTNDKQSEENESNSGEKLPNTATNIYNSLGFGIALIVAGLIALFVIRKRKLSQNY